MTPSPSLALGRRKLPQFRVALNSRCGRACFFCRPSGEAASARGDIAVSVDAVVEVAQSVRRHGIDSIKLTGGDPALYEPLEEVVRRLRQEAGYREIELISRHPAIGLRAATLAHAGLTHFTISIDTLNADLHHEICGVDDLDEILEALGRCVATGVPCKVNTVVMAGVNEGELSDLATYCDRNGISTLKFLDVIKDLDMGEETFVRRLALKRGKALRDLYVPIRRLTEYFRDFATHSAIRRQGDLGHPMASLTMPSGMQILFKDSTVGAWYGSICNACRAYPCHDALMALRLTADLRLQFCLLREDITVPLSRLVPGNRTALDQAIAQALGIYGDASFSRSADIAEHTLVGV